MKWQLEITSVRRPAGLRVAGEIDLETVPVLDLALEPLLEAGNDVVLDLAELTFIDVTGVRALARTASQLRSAGLQLHLVRVSANVRLLFGLSGWAHLLGLSGVVTDPTERASG